MHNVVFSSGIPGVDARTGELPESAAEQVRLAFENLDRFLDAADASLEDVVKLAVSINDEALRAEVNRHWLQRFPDPASRPARHTQVIPLRGSLQAQLEVVAVLAP